MKKKILFVMPHLKTGGITTAFLNLINAIKDDENLDIDVFVFDTDDKELLPAGVNVLPVGKLTRLLAVNQRTIESESMLLGFVRLLLGGIARFIADHLAYSFVFMLEKELSGYDAAISFSQSGGGHSLFGGMNEFVLTKVDAKKKITVLHCDYGESGIDSPYNAELYQLFDVVCAVSESVKEVFLEYVPECSNNTYVMHNCHDFEKMMRLASDDPVQYDRSVVNILSVGRLSKEKGHMRVIESLYKLKEEGFRFCWHIVGGGKEAQKILDAAQRYNMSRNIILYGDTDNPYRYYLNADMLLVPSYHEAAPMVFGEAEFFRLPVLTTRTTSAEELVTERNIGIVVENSEEGIYKGLEYVAQNLEILRKIKNYGGREIPDNNKALEEFYRIIEGE